MSKPYNSKALTEADSASFDLNPNELFSGDNTESFDSSPVVFLADAAKHSKDLESMEKYVESEVRRIASEKKGIVKALLTNRANVAMVPSRLLFGKISELGISHVWLKLTKACDESRGAPDKDPHGALISEKYRGRVLVAKLGNKGGDIKNSENADQLITDKFSGKRRQALFTQRNAYNTVNITVVPSKMPLEKAILVMAQWGFGIRDKRMISRAASKTDKTTVYQDSWIVEECNFDQAYQDVSGSDPNNNILV